MAEHPPSMDRLLESESGKLLISKYGRNATKRALRRSLDSLIKAWRDGGPIPDENTVSGMASSILTELREPVLKRVVNCTGVVLHTNLGRAPLAPDILEKLPERLSGYMDLEIDIDRNERGHRDLRLEKAFQDLLDTDYSVIVVNNNAGAVLLLLNTLSEGRECLVSRGELVEIGGGFRMPEVMKASGAILKEVGTTNRTRLADYSKAVGKNTGLLLKVHTSNYRVMGFTEEVSVEELSELGRELGIPVGYDLGSGMLMTDFPDTLSEEPSVRSSLSEKPDVITFSGDKLAGICQAGVLLVKPDIASRFRSNPLLRALRVDKTTYYLLGETLNLYRRGLEDSIPAVMMLKTDKETLEKRAGDLATRIGKAAPGVLDIEVVDAEGRAGAGSAPLVPIASPAVSLSPLKGSTGAFESFLRTGGTPPVLTVISDDRVLIHVRTMLEREEDFLLQRISAYKEVCGK